jgi:hypothetical protein
MPFDNTNVTDCPCGQVHLFDTTECDATIGDLRRAIEGLPDNTYLRLHMQPLSECVGFCYNPDVEFEPNDDNPVPHGEFTICFEW